MSRLSIQYGTSTSHNRMGPHGTLQGEPYFPPRVRRVHLSVGTRSCDERDAQFASASALATARCLAVSTRNQQQQQLSPSPYLATSEPAVCGVYFREAPTFQTQIQLPSRVPYKIENNYRRFGGLKLCTLFCY